MLRSHIAPQSFTLEAAVVAPDVAQLLDAKGLSANRQLTDWVLLRSCPKRSQALASACYSAFRERLNRRFKVHSLAFKETT